MRCDGRPGDIDFPARRARRSRTIPHYREPARQEEGGTRYHRQQHMAAQGKPRRELFGRAGDRQEGAEYQQVPEEVKRQRPGAQGGGSEHRGPPPERHVAGDHPCRRGQEHQKRGIQSRKDECGGREPEPRHPPRVHALRSLDPRYLEQNIYVERDRQRLLHAGPEASDRERRHQQRGGRRVPDPSMKLLGKPPRDREEEIGEHPLERGKSGHESGADAAEEPREEHEQPHPERMIAVGARDAVERGVPGVDNVVGDDGVVEKIVLHPVQVDIRAGQERNSIRRKGMAAMIAAVAAAMRRAAWWGGTGMRIC